MFSTLFCERVMFSAIIALWHPPLFSICICTYEDRFVLLGVHLSFREQINRNIVINFVDIA
jgi:hypothetical protein